MDTGSNLLIMRLHGEAAGPWLQALHTFFCVGAVASPLLVNAVNEFNTAFYNILAILSDDETHVLVPSQQQTITRRAKSHQRNSLS